MSNPYASKQFRYALERAESELKDFKYSGIFDPPIRSAFNQFLVFNFPRDALAIEHVEKITSAEALGPPHALDLLKPVESPKIPDLPSAPIRDLTGPEGKSLLARYEHLKETLEELRARLDAKIRWDNDRASIIAATCLQGDLSAVRDLILIAFRRHPLPTVLSLDPRIVVDRSSRIALCTIRVPDLARLPIMMHRGRWSAPWRPISETKRKIAQQQVLYGLCVRAAYLTAMTDPSDYFSTVAVNAEQEWHDPATGTLREGLIASLQATKSALRSLNPGHLDAKLCFRNLKGIATPNISNAAPIRPIFIFDTEDDRIVENRDVASKMHDETNLAAMPWEDFEHFVRQLFEWLFAKDGMEVKVTQASRDRGVDAIMFDPDPVRGGKYVLQAKRYTRTVDVAAVRDLYGTILNEGANRGILVTTSFFGPDAYDFAKDKPISLIDGPNLLALLKKEGRHYRIDLEEARRAESSPP